MHFKARCVFLSGQQSAKMACDVKKERKRG